jgi:hypothetical protein
MTKPYQSSGEFCRARPERCPAALVADSRPCEGEPDEVRVIDRTGHGTSACLLHGAVLLASLEGGRVFPGYGGHASAIDVRCRAREMRPFDGVWTGPGVQRVSTFEEAAVFPSDPDPTPACPHLCSSGLGNASRARWVPGQRYQAGHASGGATEPPRAGGTGDGCKEVVTR